MIYLISTSPRRKQLLKKAGLDFKILKPRHEEDARLKGVPSQIVKTHALKKAQSCASQIKNGILLGADTMVYWRREIIGKPKNMRNAVQILTKLQGKWQAVYTGVALLKIKSGRITKKTVFFEKTKVKMKPMTLAQIRNYFKKMNPLDKAGAYALQSSPGGMVEEVRGLLSNAIGLPIETVLQKLKSL